MKRDEIFSLKHHRKYLHQIVMQKRRKTSLKLRWFQWVLIIVGLCLSFTIIASSKPHIAQMATNSVAQQQLPALQSPTISQQSPPQMQVPQDTTQGVSPEQDQYINNAVMQAQIQLQQHQQACQQQIAAYQQQQKFLALEATNIQMEMQVAARNPGTDPFAIDTLYQQAADKQHNIAITQQAIDALVNACQYDQWTLQQYIQSLQASK